MYGESKVVKWLDIKVFLGPNFNLIYMKCRDIVLNVSDYVKAFIVQLQYSWKESSVPYMKRSGQNISEYFRIFSCMLYSSYIYCVSLCNCNYIMFSYIVLSALD